MRVENALREHPLIKKIVVVGLPCETWRENVTAVIELTDPEQIPDLEALREFGRAHLAGYKLPKALQLVDALPRTASGKVQRIKAKTLIDN